MRDFLKKITVLLFLLLTFHSVSIPQNYNNSISINGSYNDIPLLLTLETDKFHYQVGDSVQMRYEITNLDSSNASITMSCVNLFVVFYVYDENNNHIWDSGAWCLTVVWGLHIPTNELVADTNVMPSLYLTDEGNYTVYGELYCVPDTDPQYLELDFYATNPLSTIENISPQNFKLFQPYPNPFNPVTTIRFNIGVETQPRNNRNLRHATSLHIYDLTGRLIETLINESLTPGEHEIKWNAGQLPSGVYFVRLQSGAFVENQKILLMK